MEDSATDIFEGCAVIFRNVKELYASDKSIRCQFSIKKNCVLESPNDCFVGLFHVGWDTLDSCVTKKSFTLVELLTDGIYNLDFSSSETPDSNCDEFYQFCFYDIKTAVVFGASCPFQICDITPVESFVEIDQKDTLTSSGKLEHLQWWLERNNPVAVDEDLDDDAVLIHNKTTFLEDSLAKTVEENELLQISKVNFEVELFKLQQQLKEELSLKKSYDVKNDEALKKIHSEKKEIERKSASELDDLNEKLRYFQEHETKLKMNVGDLEEVINHLTSQMKEMKENITSEYEDKLKHCYESIEKLSDDRNRIVNEKQTVKEQLQELVISNNTRDALMEKQASKVKTISDECDLLKKAIENENDCNKKLENDYQDMVLSLTSQLQTMGKETHEFEKAIAKISDLEVKLKSKKKHNAVLLEELDNLAAALELTKKEHKEKECAYISKNDKIVKALEQLVEEKSVVIDELLKEKENLNSKIAHLKEKETLLCQKHQAEMSTLQDMLVELQSCFAKEKEQYLEKHTKLVILEKDAITKEFEEKMLLVTTEIQDLKANNDSQGNECAKVIQEFEAKQNELKLKIVELNKEKGLDENKVEKISDTGSRHALQVANAHMQKQLKHLKQEKDSYQKLASGNFDEELRKENENLKLRLCMGKKAYNDKYTECQTLKLQYAKLKSSITSNNQLQNQELSGTRVFTPEEIAKARNYEFLHTEFKKLGEEREKTVFRLTSERESDAKKLSELREDLLQFEKREEQLKDNVEDLKEKSRKLAEHYERKIKLLEEENITIKNQKMALLEGGVTSGSINAHNVVAEQPSNMLGAVIFHPPSSVKENVVQKQPVNIHYPPSFNVAEGHDKKPWLPAKTNKPKVTPTAPKKERDIAHYPPALQVITNRENSSNNMECLNGRGKTSFNQMPTFQCPVCGMDFPSGFSDVSATRHVNEHFKDEK